MFQLNENSIILIYCPAHIKTGGTELLHQLAHELQKKYECYMVYTKVNKKEDPKPEAFEIYQTKEARSVLKEWDSKNNLLIVPETLTDQLYNYSNIQKSIWWLSVDNYVGRNDVLKKDIFMFGNFVLRQRKLSFVFGPGQNKITHLVQSYYAWSWLRKHGVRNIGYLSDYINDIYLDIQAQCGGEREDIVLYNPKKGKEFTKKILAYDSSIRYVPICNMSNQEVVDLMKRSKVYIDFGEHPGKDRLPREAAMCGLCIITGKKGAAGNSKDVAIPEEFKFQDKDAQIPAIVQKVEACLKDYNQEVKKMSRYITRIKKEKKVFLQRIAEVFEID